MRWAPEQAVLSDRHDRCLVLHFGHGNEQTHTRSPGGNVGPDPRSCRPPRATRSRACVTNCTASSTSLALAGRGGSDVGPCRGHAPTAFFQAACSRPVAMLSSHLRRSAATLLHISESRRGRVGAPPVPCVLCVLSISVLRLCWKEGIDQ